MKVLQMHSVRHNENNENKNRGCITFKRHMSEFENLQNFTFNKFFQKKYFSLYCLLYGLVRVKIFYAEKSLFLDKLMEQHMSWNAVPDFVFGLMVECKDKCFLSTEHSPWAYSHIFLLGTSAIDCRTNSIKVQTAWLIPVILLFKKVIFVHWQ